MFHFRLTRKNLITANLIRYNPRKITALPDNGISFCIFYIFLVNYFQSFETKFFTEIYKETINSMHSSKACLHSYEWQFCYEQFLIHIPPPCIHVWKSFQILILSFLFVQRAQNLFSVDLFSYQWCRSLLRFWQKPVNLNWQFRCKFGTFTTVFQIAWSRLFLSNHVLFLRFFFMFFFWFFLWIYEVLGEKFV